VPNNIVYFDSNLIKVQPKGEEG